MKKYLFIFLGLAFAASASAGIPIKKRGDHLGLSQSHELKMERTAPRRDQGVLKAPVTEVPTMPTNATATPDVTSADVTWDGGDGDNRPNGINIWDTL